LRYVYKDYVFVNDNNKGILYKAGKLLFMGNSWSAIQVFLSSTESAPEVVNMFRAQLEQREVIKLRAESNGEKKKKNQKTRPLLFRKKSNQ
jgi:hypothetical protein